MPQITCVDDIVHSGVYPPRPLPAPITYIYIVFRDSFSARDKLHQLCVDGREPRISRCRSETSRLFSAVQSPRRNVLLSISRRQSPIVIGSLCWGRHKLFGERTAHVRHSR